MRYGKKLEVLPVDLSRDLLETTTSKKARKTVARRNSFSKIAVKLFCHGHACQSFKLLQELDLFTTLFPMLTNTDNVQLVKSFECMDQQRLKNPCRNLGADTFVSYLLANIFFIDHRALLDDITEAEGQLLKLLEQLSFIAKPAQTCSEIIEAWQMLKDAAANSTPTQTQSDDESQDEIPLFIPIQCQSDDEAQEAPTSKRIFSDQEFLEIGERWLQSKAEAAKQSRAQTKYPFTASSKEPIKPLESKPMQALKKSK